MDSNRIGAGKSSLSEARRGKRRSSNARFSDHLEALDTSTEIERLKTAAQNFSELLLGLADPTTRPDDAKALMDRVFARRPSLGPPLVEHERSVEAVIVQAGQLYDAIHNGVQPVTISARPFREALAKALVQLEPDETISGRAIRVLSALNVAAGRQKLVETK